MSRGIYEHKFVWSDPAVVRLRALIEGGSSASETAKALSREFKAVISRSAIIGKAYRLKIVGPESEKLKAASTPRRIDPPAERENRGFGVPFKAPPVKPSTGNPGAAASKAATAARKQIGIAGNGMTYETAPAVIMPRLRAIDATGEPARIIDPGFRGCRWPINDPGRGNMDQALFCCGRREPGKTYCQVHHELASGGLPKPSRAVKQPSVGPARGPGGHRYAFGGGVQ